MSRKSRGARSRSRGTLAGTAIIASAAILYGFTDLFGLTSATGLVTSLAAIPHINKPPKDIAEKRTPTNPTVLFMQSTWGDGLPHDIDIWLECRWTIDGNLEDFLFVGFSVRNNKWMDLQQDDLGGPSILNLEKMQSNENITSIPPLARCRVNVHLYHSHGGALPVSVKLIVIQNKDSETDEHIIATVDVTMNTKGEEITALEMFWDERGRLVKRKIYPYVKTTKIATVSRATIINWTR